MTISNIIAGVALFISVLSPFVVYYRLDPRIKEIEDKRIIYSERFDSVHSHATTVESPQGRMSVWIKNVGKLAVDEVTVSVRLDGERPNWSPQPEVEPPLPFNTERKAGTFVLTFKRKLGPNDEVTVRLPVTLPTPLLWVGSEVGSAAIVLPPPPVGQGTSRPDDPPGDQP